MTSRRSSSAYVLPPGGAWTERHPTFKRTVKLLFKKAWLIKLRHPASIIEFIVAVLIGIVMYPVWYLARSNVEAVVDPPLEYENRNMNFLVFFVGSGNPTLAAYPDVQRMHDLIQATMLETELNMLLQMVKRVDMGIDASDIDSFKFQYVDNYDEMENLIYSSDANGIGVTWLNYNDETNHNYLLNPKFEIYRQSLFGDVNYEFTAALQTAVVSMISQEISNGNLNADDYNIDPVLLGRMQNANISSQVYSKPGYTSFFDISIALNFFAIIPIVIATMPDVQTILEDKDSKVMSLTFLMGCSETAYWLVCFSTQFILSLIPYIIFCAMFAWGFMMTNTPFTLTLDITNLFIIAHLFFQMWILTFIKTGTAGRALTVVFIILTLFFGYLHQFFTLSEDNNSEVFKHIFSIVPLSCYQLFLMGAYRQELNSYEPTNWSNLGRNSVYSAEMALYWLFIDIVIYFLLFFIFNLCMPRPFCTPPLRWSELFSPAAWKRFLGQPAVSTEQVSSQSEEFIRVQGLKKVYKGRKDVTALDDVDFFVKRGEVIVMIGPNGAGKSTLINILSGAIEPTEGKVNILGGAETNRFKELQQYLGVCFQENVIIDLLSIREHLYLFGAFRGVPEEQIDEAVEFFGEQLQLTHMLENRAGDLSGGQKRKLCIAMSLLGNPPLVIMDEPTAGVDVQARQLIWKMISCLKDTTTIVTSHALEEAEAVSSRLFIASAGKLPFCGTSTELRNEYKCGYILGVSSVKDDLKPIIDVIKGVIPSATVSEDRDDVLHLPVCDEIPLLLKKLEEKKEEIGLQNYAFSVEQLEDMLLKLIQSDEAKVQTN